LGKLQITENALESQYWKLTKLNVFETKAALMIRLTAFHKSVRHFNMLILANAYNLDNPGAAIAISSKISETNESVEVLSLQEF
jgi:hypothetical protein